VVQEKGVLSQSLLGSWKEGGSERNSSCGGESSSRLHLRTKGGEPKSLGKNKRGIRPGLSVRRNYGAMGMGQWRG